jgi:hypothetical protein
MSFVNVKYVAEWSFPSSYQQVMILDEQFVTAARISRWVRQYRTNLRPSWNVSLDFLKLDSAEHC